MAYKKNRNIAIKYYGSKANMYEKIIEQLEIDKTKVYVELFGGGASVLLNKPRHDIEIYNEANFGVYTLFKVLSDRKKGKELRNRLKEVVYSEDTFHESVMLKNNFEGRGLMDVDRRIATFIKYIQKKYNSFIIKHYREAYRKILEEENLTKEQVEQKIDNKGTGDQKLDAIINNMGLTEGEKKYAEALYNERVAIIENDDINNGKLSQKKELTDEDELVCAQANFIFYNMSWNGMGGCFSKRDGQNNFNRRVDDLLNVIERLQGVTVLNENAFDLLDRDILNARLNEKNIDISHYGDNEIMYYLDPPYLEDQRVAWNKKKHGKKQIVPGDAYLEGKGIIHKLLLIMLVNTKSLMLVSNYRDESHLYDTYLSEQNGWRSIEFETKTTMGKENKDRTEVLWKNF